MTAHGRLRTSGRAGYRNETFSNTMRPYTDSRGGTRPLSSCGAGARASSSITRSLAPTVSRICVQSERAQRQRSRPSPVNTFGSLCVLVSIPNEATLSCNCGCANLQLLLPAACWSTERRPGTYTRNQGHKICMNYWKGRCVDRVTH